MKKNKKLQAICFLVAAICYYLVSYGAFYTSDIIKGILYICIASSMLCLSLENFKNNK